MTNPFNRTLDQALQGSYCKVQSTEGRIFEGWVDMMHHQRGSVVLHDAKDLEAEQSVGSVFIRTTDWIVEEEKTKDIIVINPEIVGVSPYYPNDPEPVDKHMRAAYRNGFTGSFPVVRRLPEDHDRYGRNRRFELINGHKRLNAMIRSGLFQHPFEVIRCTEEEQQELIEMEHRRLFEGQGDDDDVPSAESQSIPDSVDPDASASEMAEESEFESDGQGVPYDGR